MAIGHDRCRTVAYGVGERRTPPEDHEEGRMAKRFIPLSEVCEILDISSAQAYALVRSGDLPAIKVGGRGQWRVETVELESYIQRMYAKTAQLVASGELDDA
jgi:excisionase family DNA binding protein